MKRQEFLSGKLLGFSYDICIVVAMSLECKFYT